MQDATAQMAMLQFISSGLPKVAGIAFFSVKLISRNFQPNKIPGVASVLVLIMLETMSGTWAWRPAPEAYEIDSF